jgi:uncharacterized membrane protein YdjX (TVP38/TMEM64 family)
MRASAVLRIVVAVLLAAAIGATLLFLPAREYLGRTLDWVEGSGAWGPVAVAGLYAIACLAFVPGSILTLGSGFLFGVVWGTVAASIGSTLGATAAFLVGRSLARPWVERKVAAYPRFRALDRAVGEQGFKIVFLVRLSPLFPFNLLNYAFGLTRVSLRDYLLASWIGMLPATLMYAYLGSAAKGLAELISGEFEGGVGQQVLFAAGLVVTVIVTVIVTRIAAKALNEAVPGPGEVQAATQGETHG